MLVGGGTYELLGTDAQIAIVEPCFRVGSPSAIAFPWSRLSPPSKPIPIGWMNLNALDQPGITARGAQSVNYGATLEHPHAEPHAPDIPGHVHIEDADGNEGHGILRKIDGRWWIAGVFWTDGRIYVDTRCETQPDLAREVVSAELAHSVDYFLPLSNGMKSSLMKLWHPGDEDAHTWWEIHDYGAEYYDLGGEAFMAAFTLAYSSIEPDQSAFTHKTSRDMGPTVRAILGVYPDGGEAPLIVIRVGRGRRFHRATCWIVRFAEIFGRDTERLDISTATSAGLTSCRICRPSV